MTALRQYHPDELTAAQRENMCPACRMRYKFPANLPRELYGPLNIDRIAYRWLENAARVFDVQSDELFTAAEFVAWIRPDLLDHPRGHVEADGAPARLEGGMVADHRSRLAHRHPFPLAQAGLPAKIRRAR